VIAVATHGLFTPEAARVLPAGGIDRVLVTDTAGTQVAPALAGLVERVPAAGLVAEAIGRLHRDGSLVELG
jgi:ribose-phosphate pyrophosphokinase